jgi:RNA polymerase sigma-70 factor (ECF subfamily)
MVTDEQLMEMVRDDVTWSFEELLDRWQLLLLGVIAGLVSNTAEAEDLAQEVFTRVWRGRKKYVAGSTFSTWVYTITHEVVAKHRKNSEE